MPRGLARHETIMVESCAEGAHSTELQGDEERLRQLGYKQELRRELSLLKNFAVSFGMLSMLTGLGGYYGFGFAYGGPMVVIWGWVLIVGMTFTVALSMAEICSSLPTTGGVYYWAGALSGKWGPMWAWISAWMSLLGQVGITAGVEYTAVNYLEGMIQVKYPDFFFDKGNGEFWAVYCVFTIFHGILNAISVRVLGWLSISSVYWHVVGTPINSIAVMVAAACALGVTMLGSVVAFNAIASIGIIGLIVSYIIPIFLRLTVARRWFKRGSFHLGALSHVVGWVAVVWGLFISAALILPTAYPVTKENLNYSSVAIGGTLLLCVLTWGLTARTWFKGPARNIDTGTKTEVLADAYMHGKLDEMDALADVSGTNGATKGDQFSAQ